MKEEDDRKERKKSKRKKKSEEKEPDQNIEAEVTMADSNEHSRSTSRGRKSLSSFFRKSGESKQRSRSRSESRDKSKSKSNSKTLPNNENVEASLVEVNPRIEPREHIRRMTVREALKDSRARGRSPARATARLEKTVLDLTDGHRDSLSSSAPHLLEMSLDQENDDWNKSEQVSGSTLPRSRRHRRRGHSADPSARKRTKTDDNDTIFPKKLPLDKRKYIIDKDKITYPNQETHSVEINTIEPHSIIQEPVIPVLAPTSYLQQEKSRRESFNQFLQLRDSIPYRYSSSSLTAGKESSIDENQFPIQTPEKSDLMSPNEHITEDKTQIVLPTYQESKNENKSQTKTVKNKRKSKLINSESEEFHDCCSSPISEGIVLNKESRTDDGKHISFQETSAAPDFSNDLHLIESVNQRKKSDSNVKSESLLNSTCTDDSVNCQRGESIAEHLGEHDNTKLAYVSPRKFSRTSKASIKSDSSCSSVVTQEQSACSEEVKLSIENETQIQPKPVVRPKYHRHFSRKKSIATNTENDTPHNNVDIKVQETNEPKDVLPLESGGKESQMLVKTDPKSVDNQNAKIQSPSIQIGSKTYIAAVSAFKALLRKNTDVAKALGNGNAKPATEPKTLSCNNSNDSGTDESAMPDILCATENDSDIKSKPNLVRPKFTLSTETDNAIINSEEDTNVSTFPDDEVFHILQPDSIHPEPENTSVVPNNHKGKEDSSLLHQNDSLLAKRSASQDVTSFLPTDDTDRHFRRVSDQTSDSEESERHSSLPIISSGLIKESHSLKVDENKAIKAKSEQDISDKKETDDKIADTGRTDKMTKLQVKAKKGKDKQRKKKGKGKLKKNKNTEVTTKVTAEQSETALKGILKRQTEAQDEIKEKLKKTENKNKQKTNKTEVEKAKLVGKRSSSLTDIRKSSTEEKIKKPQKSKSSLHIRSKSVEDISEQSKTERKKSKASIEKVPLEKQSAGASKPHARLSISAVVLFKRKIARMRKAKQRAAEENAPNTEDNLERNEANIEENLTEKIDDGDKALIENEVNVSLGKLTGISENEIIDDELESIYERKIKFDPYCRDDISEEELIKQRQRNTRLTSRRESKVRQRQKKVISCCKKFIAFLFSHIGLCSLMVAYSIAGGFIFQELEAPYEMQKNNEMETLRLKILQDIWDLAFEVNYNKGSREVFKTEVNAILKNYSQRIQRETKESGWDGDSGSTLDGEELVKQAKLWSFPSSLLFAITVMTTIGKFVLFCFIHL